MMQPVLAIEALLMKSANGEELKNFEQSVFKSDFCIEKLKREL